MKIKLKPFYALLTFTISLSIFFVPNNNAQSKSGKNDKKEEIEVQKFINSFYAIFEDTNDLQKVPESYFVSDFKTRFVEADANNNSDIIEPNLYNKLGENERFEFDSAVFNSSHMVLMHLFGKFNFADDATEEGTEDVDWFSMENLPPQIATMMKSNKVFNKYFTQDDKNTSNKVSKIKTAEELRELIGELETLANTQRVALNVRPSEQKTQYTKNMKSLRETFYDYYSELCSDDCEGFPKNTQIISFRGYPEKFKIARINGELKIFDLTMNIGN